MSRPKQLLPWIAELRRAGRPIRYLGGVKFVCARSGLWRSYDGYLAMVSQVDVGPRGGERCVWELWVCDPTKPGYPWDAEPCSHETTTITMGELGYAVRGMQPHLIFADMLTDSRISTP